jgi:hypothetical protein
MRATIFARTGSGSPYLSKIRCAEEARLVQLNLSGVQIDGRFPTDIFTIAEGGAGAFATTGVVEPGFRSQKA